MSARDDARAALDAWDDAVSDWAGHAQALAEALQAVLAEQGEPEWEWALMADGDDEPWSNYYKSREHLAEQCGGLAWREDERLVRRRAPGPWLPVEENTEALTDGSER